MTQFYTDFAQHTLGSQPSEWVDVYHGASWDVTSNASMPGGVDLRLTSTAPQNLYGARWTQPGSSPADAEIAGLLQCPDSTFEHWLMLRGATATKSGYIAGFDEFGRLQIRRWSSGSEVTLATDSGTTVAAGEIWWVRFEATGTTVRVRAWEDGTAEPGTWNRSVTDSTHSSGWVGLATTAGSSGNMRAGAVGVGTSGDPAPLTHLPQTVSPNGFTGSPSFGSVTLSPGTASLSPASLGNSPSFGSVTPTAQGAAPLGPAGFGNTPSFGAVTLDPQPVALSPAALSNVPSFGSAALRHFLAPGSLSNAPSFGTVTLDPQPVSLSPDGLGNGPSFGAVALATGPADLTPGSLVNQPAFGLVSLSTTARAKLLELLATNSGRKIWLVDLTLDGTTHRWSSHGFTARPDDPAVPNVFWDPRILAGFHVKQSRIQGNLLRGRSVPDAGTLALTNLDRGLSELGLEDAPGGEFVLRLGSDGWLTTELGTIFTGIVERVRPGERGQRYLVDFADPSRQLETRLQEDRYRGFGQAIELDGSTGYVQFPYDDSFLPSDAITVEIYLQIHTARSQIFASQGNWSLGQNVSNEIEFTLVDDQGTLTTVTSTTTYPDGWEGRLSGRWDGSELTIFVDGIQDGKAAAFAGSPRQETDDLFIGSGTAPSNFAHVWWTDFRLWTDSRTDDELADLALLPIPVDPSAGDTLSLDESEDLALYAATNESVGTNTWDDFNGWEGTLVGGATWTSTLTGFPELADKPKPTTWGFVWHRHAVLVDPIDLIYQVHHRKIRDILGVFEGGKKLAPERTETAINGLNFRAARQRIEWVPLSLIPLPGTIGPFAAFGPGQSMDVIGTGQDGTYTLTAVHPFGHWVEVAEVITEALYFPGGGATVETTSGTHDYTVDLETGTFQLLASPSHIVTARVRGDNVPDHPTTIVELFRRLLTGPGGLPVDDLGSSLDQGGALDTEYYWEHGYATDTEDVDIAVVLDRLAGSIGATWGYDMQTGKIELEVFKAPDLEDGTVLELTRDVELLDIRRLRDIEPVEEVVVSYRPNFAQLTWDDLVGEVQQDTSPTGQAHRQMLLSPSLSSGGKHTSPTPAFGVSEDREHILSYSILGIGPRKVAGEQLALHGVRREVFATRTKLQPLRDSYRNLVVEVTDPSWQTTANGKPFKVVSIEVERNNVTMEVWG